MNQTTENELWDFWLESAPETRIPFHILKQKINQDTSEWEISDDYIKGFFDGLGTGDSYFPKYHKHII